MTDHELAERYRATSYIVEAPGGAITIRIGRPNGELDHLLERMGADEWAFITAWNPNSLLLPPAENDRNNNDLRERLDRMGLRHVSGEGAGDDGEWPPERSFFIPGITRDEAVALGRRYGQRAIVAGRRGGAAELVWCHSSLPR